MLMMMTIVDMKMKKVSLSITILVMGIMCGLVSGGIDGHILCRQCSKCEARQCPASESYPHMTAFDNSLIVGALQSDLVGAHDRGLYSVPNPNNDVNTYFGWESTSGSASGYHRFSNYMDKCGGGHMYMTADRQGEVRVRPMDSLDSPAEADWKSYNPPTKMNHREYRFWVSRSTGKCLTVFGNTNNASNKKTVGVADCRFDASNPAQLFAFRFHYHGAFCCCALRNP